MIEKQDEKAISFSIFFRGCNQHKFIHTYQGQNYKFLRLKSLYLKNIVINFWLTPEKLFPDSVAVL